MRPKSTFPAICVIIGALSAYGPDRAAAGNIDIGGGSFSVSVRTVKDQRFAHSIKQAYDFSCGSAAVADLLTYSYGISTSERQVFDVMYARGNQKQIRALGFSLLDIRNYLQNRGLVADGFRISLAKLLEIRLPVITLITVKGYKHFVVIRGSSSIHLLVADPALGLRVMSDTDFKTGWNGIVFVIRSDQRVGMAHFNQSVDWLTQYRANLDVTVARSRDGLGAFLLSLPGFHEF